MRENVSLSFFRVSEVRIGLDCYYWTEVARALLLVFKRPPPPSQAFISFPLSNTGSRILVARIFPPVGRIVTEIGRVSLYDVLTHFHCFATGKDKEDKDTYNIYEIS